MKREQLIHSELIHINASAEPRPPVEVDQSFGALLMTWGLWTEPCHGEPGSSGAVRRRRVGEAKGLSRSGVKGDVRGLCGPAPMERRKTDAGVFIRKVGLELMESSVPGGVVLNSLTLSLGQCTLTNTQKCFLCL